MFSGIVETTSRVLATHARDEVLELRVQRPAGFDDLSVGDSIAINGICLTVERYNEQEIQFALGPETIRVTGWTAERVQSMRFNVERSLRVGDRIHGHLVTGHVDAVTHVVARSQEGETLRLEIAIPDQLKLFIWPKGSIALNGVSLTINQVTATAFSVGLIPETLKRTQLNDLEVGTLVNLEVDNMARGFVRWAEHANADRLARATGELK